MIKFVEDEAKPCPMCGSEHIYIKYPKNTACLVRELMIACADCGLRGYKSTLIGKVSLEEAEKRVINYWNTRSEVEHG